jgi:hypothetical protein
MGRWVDCMVPGAHTSDQAHIYAGHCNRQAAGHVSLRGSARTLEMTSRTLIASHLSTASQQFRPLRYGAASPKVIHA